jgi:hypothetical protein
MTEDTAAMMIPNAAKPGTNQAISNPLIAATRKPNIHFLMSMLLGRS